MKEGIVEIIQKYEGELAKLNQELQLVKEELQAIRSSKEPIKASLDTKVIAGAIHDSVSKDQVKRSMK